MIVTVKCMVGCNIQNTVVLGLWKVKVFIFEVFYSAILVLNLWDLRSVSVVYLGIIQTIFETGIVSESGIESHCRNRLVSETYKNLSYC